jgi:hypothetical protein
VAVTVEIQGVKETLKALQRLDPAMRKEFNRNARTVAKPAMDAAKSRYTTLPLSGFRRRWTSGGRELSPKTIGRFRSGVTFRVDTTKKRESVFVIRQTNALAEITDMAGRRNRGNQLDRSLTIAGWGSPSRVMWPAVESKARDIQAALAELVAAASETINRELGAR